ncbi:hypothetical protein PTKIN_Ptkin07bG0097200 [Pterospermum kingtungense]
MEDVFKVMDKDGDGRLSHDDLKSYMNRAGFSATKEDIKAMIRLGGGDVKKVFLLMVCLRFWVLIFLGT